MYHGFCPGTDVPTGWVFGYIDLQITIRRVEPPGPLFLLFLQHKLKGARQSQLIVLRWHSWHRGRNLHVILGAGLLTDNGVPVSVACSVSLKVPQRGNINHNSCLSPEVMSVFFRQIDEFYHLKEQIQIIPWCSTWAQCPFCSGQFCFWKSASKGRSPDYARSPTKIISSYSTSQLRLLALMNRLPCTWHLQQEPLEAVWEKTKYHFRLSALQSSH